MNHDEHISVMTGRLNVLPCVIPLVRKRLSSAQVLLHFRTNDEYEDDYMWMYEDDIYGTTNVTGFYDPAVTSDAITSTTEDWTGKLLLTNGRQSFRPENYGTPFCQISLRCWHFHFTFDWLST